jgi:hypothetical protein
VRWRVDTTVAAGVKELPQSSPFPGYALAQIRWPSHPEFDGG